MPRHFGLFLKLGPRDQFKNLHLTRWHRFGNWHPLGSISFDTLKTDMGETFFWGVRFGNFQQTAQVPKNQIIHLGVVNISCDTSSYFFYFGSKRRWFSRIRESQSQRFFLGLLMNTFPQNHATKKTMVFFGSLLFAIFFPIERGDPFPLIP